jgi:hypothetical protein
MQLDVSVFSGISASIACGGAKAVSSGQAGNRTVSQRPPQFSSPPCGQKNMSQGCHCESQNHSVSDRNSLSPKPKLEGSGNNPEINANNANSSSTHNAPQYKQDASRLNWLRGLCTYDKKLIGIINDAHKQCFDNRIPLADQIQTINKTLQDSTLDPTIRVRLECRRDVLESAQKLTQETPFETVKQEMRKIRDKLDRAIAKDAMQVEKSRDKGTAELTRMFVSLMKSPECQQHLVAANEKLTRLAEQETDVEAQRMLQTFIKGGLASEENIATVVRGEMDSIVNRANLMRRFDEHQFSSRAQLFNLLYDKVRITVQSIASSAKPLRG